MDEFVCDMFLESPTHTHGRVGQPVKIYLHQPSRAMSDRDGRRDRIKGIHVYQQPIIIIIILYI